MIKSIQKFRLIIITVFFVLFSLIVESPFHGYYPPLGMIFTAIFISQLFYLLPNQKFILAEKIVYSFLMSIVAIMIGAIATHLILGSTYGYDIDYYDELKSPEVLENLVFYFITLFTGFSLFAIWSKYKNPIY